MKIVDGNEIVATHPRSWHRGQQIEQSDPLERMAAEKRRAREHRGLERVSSVTTRLFEHRRQRRGPGRLSQIGYQAGPPRLAHLFSGCIRRRIRLSVVCRQERR